MIKTSETDDPADLCYEDCMYRCYLDPEECEEICSRDCYRPSYPGEDYSIDEDDEGAEGER